MNIATNLDFKIWKKVEFVILETAYINLAQIERFDVL